MEERGDHGAVYQATFRLLSHHFSVRTGSPSVAGLVDRTFGAFRAEPIPDATLYTLSEARTGATPRFELALDGRVVLDTDVPERALDFFAWDVMRAVTDRCDDVVLVHAGVVACESGAVLLPATSGSGKTTLVAGLVDAGFSYLSDEIAAIVPDSGMVVPFPLGLSVKPGSFAVLAAFLPDVADDAGRFSDGRYPLPPEDIRPGAVGRPAPVRLIITPRYREGAATRLTPCSRAQGLADMAHNAFNLDRLGRRGFDVLARVATSARCHRLDVGSLADAVAAVQAVAGGIPALPPAVPPSG